MLCLVLAACAAYFVWWLRQPTPPSEELPLLTFAEYEALGWEMGEDGISSLEPDWDEQHRRRCREWQHRKLNGMRRAGEPPADLRARVLAYNDQVLHHDDSGAFRPATKK